MLHKTDKYPIYGVRGIIAFFKEKTRFYLKEKRTYEKTYFFSHALFSCLFCLAQDFKSLVQDSIFLCFICVFTHPNSHDFTLLF